MGWTWTWRTSIPLATHQFSRSPHIFCVFCPVPSLLLLWTVLLGPHRDLWLCDLLWQQCCLTDGTSNLWTKWWRLLLTILLFSSFLFLITVQVFTIPFPPVCDLFNSSQIFTSRRLDTLQTWLELSSNWFDYLEELPGIFIGVCCFQFHAHAFQLLLFIHSELSPYPSLQFLISVLIFIFVSLFSLIVGKVSWDIYFFFFATWRTQSFLWTLPAGLSWYLSRDLLGWPHTVQHPMP